MKASIVFSTLICFVLSFFCVTSSALADGMVVFPDPYSDRWDYGVETNQYAFIKHTGGKQEMIISVGFDEVSSKGMVWLFPIPSKPENMKISIVDSVPTLSGEEVSKKAKAYLDIYKKVYSYSQIYPIISKVNFSNRNHSSLDSLGGGFGESNINESSIDVVVHNHIEKDGIVSEVVTAKTSSSLYDYLKSKGMSIEPGSVPVLKQYIGKDYSFVVSWIDTSQDDSLLGIVMMGFPNYYSKVDYPGFFALVEELKKDYPEFGASDDLLSYLQSPEGASVLKDLLLKVKADPSLIRVDNADLESLSNESLGHQQRGLSVTFPTKDIYFPLLPTSVYGDEVVPLTIYVSGHVSPKVFKDIKSFTDVSYYVNHINIVDNMLWGYGYSEFLEKQKMEGVEYTKIVINAPSKYFTNDLWMETKAPIKAYYPSLVAKHMPEAGIIIFLLSSVIAGLIAGMILFKDLRRRPLGIILISLFNSLSIIGLITAVLAIRTKNDPIELESILSDMKSKGYLWKRRLSAILFLIFIPLCVFSFLFTINLGFRRGSAGIIVLVLNSIVILMLLAILFLRKKSPCDRESLVELKRFGYSTWSFYPRDRMKLLFIPIFSILFLIVSSALLELLRITL
jgi:hypothetical protein